MWLLAAHAQQVERVRRIGVLVGLSPDDPQGKAIVAAFLQGLQQLGRATGSRSTGRVPLGGRQPRRYAQIRGGIGNARAGRHRGHWWNERGAVAAGDKNYSDRVRKCPRSGWLRLKFARAATPMRVTWMAQLTATQTDISSPRSRSGIVEHSRFQPMDVRDSRSSVSISTDGLMDIVRALSWFIADLIALAARAMPR